MPGSVFFLYSDEDLKLCLFSYLAVKLTNPKKNAYRGVWSKAVGKTRGHFQNRFSMSPLHLKIVKEGDVFLGFTTERTKKDEWGNSLVAKTWNHKF